MLKMGGTAMREFNQSSQSKTSTALASYSSKKQKSEMQVKTFTSVQDELNRELKRNIPYSWDTDKRFWVHHFVLI